MFIIRSDKTRIFDVHFGGYLIANQSANSEETIRRAARELQHSCPLCGVHVLYICEPPQLRLCASKTRTTQPQHKQQWPQADESAEDEVAAAAEDISCRLSRHCSRKRNETERERRLRRRARGGR